MKNTLQIAFYTFIGFLFIGLNNVNAVINSGTANVSDGIKGSNTTLDIYLQSIINWLMTFLALIGFFYLLWGGFQFLTGGGDEEKVKKGKTIIIQSLIGIGLIFAAWSIVSLVIQGLTTSA